MRRIVGTNPPEDAQHSPYEKSSERDKPQKRRTPRKPTKPASPGVFVAADAAAASFLRLGNLASFLRPLDLASFAQMPPKTKRSLAGSQEESSKRSKRDPLDTIRFVLPQAKDAPLTTYLVQYYTQLYGQNLFMEEGDGYIDVKFVDTASANHVKANLYRVNPPFLMKPRLSIDLADIRVKSPGRVTMYQAPRDRGHQDEKPYLPHGWNNPFPIQFKVPPIDPAKPVKKPARPPRVKPIYPPLAQPPPPSPAFPFEQPEWPLQKTAKSSSA